MRYADLSWRFWTAEHCGHCETLIVSARNLSRVASSLMFNYTAKTSVFLWKVAFLPFTDAFHAAILVWSLDIMCLTNCLLHIQIIITNANCLCRCFNLWPNGH